MSGMLALVGDDAWDEPRDYDRRLIEASGGDRVTVLATAAAFSRPERIVAAATDYFKGLDVAVDSIPVYQRPAASDAANIELVNGASLLYLLGGSPMHLVAVVKATPLWEAIVARWQGGMTLAASRAGAMVLCDPMVDPRGGAFTVGLGLIPGFTAIPHADTWSPEKLHRTLGMAPKGVALATLEHASALVHDGSWSAIGPGAVQAFRDSTAVALDDLPHPLS